MKTEYLNVTHIILIYLPYPLLLSVSLFMSMFSLVDMTTDDVAPLVLVTSLQAPSQSPKKHLSPLSLSFSQTYRSRTQITDVNTRRAEVKGGERRWKKNKR